MDAMRPFVSGDCESVCPTCGEYSNTAKDMRIRHLEDQLAIQVDAYKQADDQLEETQAHAFRLLAALTMAVRQNQHDMLMTADELRQCEQAIANA